MAFSIFNGALTNTYQPTNPVDMAGEHIVLDWALTIANLLTPAGTAATVQFYFEYASTDPNAATTVWYRETTEEDIGNGDVRMNKAVRRFSEQGADLPLAEGSHQVDMQFNRKHNYFRLQVRTAVGSADNCRAQIWSVLGRQPISPA
jgi:hypothetical protein